MKNHPFVDGNKRTGLVAALAFLELNGYSLRADRSHTEAMVLAVAAGEQTKADATAFFATHTAKGP